MRTYVMMIAGGAILSAFADIMVPSSWKKYMRIITGFILLAVIMSPAGRLGFTDIFSQSFPADEVEYTPMPELVADELEKRVEEDAEERIKREYGADCDIDASVSLNSEGLIKSVDRISVRTSSTRREAIQKRLYEVYGAEKVEFLD